MASEGEKPAGALVLVGVEGLVEGEVFQVNPGESVVLGRSRSCDISLRKCFKYLALDPEERKDDRHFQTVSRRHIRLAFKDADQVEVENMGANGTFIDGTKIDKVIITDIRHQTHELLLGTREKFRLEWRPEGSPPIKPAGTFDEGAPGTEGKEDRVSEGPTKRVAQKPATEKGQR
jgi:pSer/pThr/pTyr-binding forkhead associated (FHA) protein